MLIFEVVRTGTENGWGTLAQLGTWGAPLFGAAAAFLTAWLIVAIAIRVLHIGATRPPNQRL